jgi:hypothetical protein
MHHNRAPGLILCAMYTIRGCFGAANHGTSGSLCCISTCSWRVANFGFQLQVVHALNQIGVFVLVTSPGSRTAHFSSTTRSTTRQFIYKRPLPWPSLQDGCFTSSPLRHGLAWAHTSGQSRHDKPCPSHAGVVTSCACCVCRPVVADCAVSAEWRGVSLSCLVRDTGSGT